MTSQTDPEGTETKALHRFADFRGRRVLEVGCGDGRLTWRYARGADRVVAMELKADELRMARLERPSDLEHRVSFARADAVHQPFSTGSFDLALFAWSF